MKKLKKLDNVKNQTVESYTMGARGNYRCYCTCSCPPSSVPNDIYLKLSSDENIGVLVIGQN